MTDQRPLSDPMGQRRWLCGLLVVWAVAAIVGVWRDPRPAQVRDQRAVQPWMADALPGVGPKRKDMAAQVIRRGAFDELPAQARAQARVWFGGRTEDER